jgi:hypothetical protein
MRYLKQNPWPLVRKQTIPTEPPPLVGEISAKFCGRYITGINEIMCFELSISEKKY